MNQWSDSAYALRTQIARLERLRSWNPERIDPILDRLRARLVAAGGLIGTDASDIGPRSESDDD